MSLFITIVLVSFVGLWLYAQFWRWLLGVNRQHKMQEKILKELQRANDLKEMQLRGEFPVVEKKKETPKVEIFGEQYEIGEVKENKQEDAYIEILGKRFSKNQGRAKTINELYQN